MTNEQRIAVLESHHDYELASATDVIGKLSGTLDAFRKVVTDDPNEAAIRAMSDRDLRLMWMCARIGYRQTLISYANRNSDALDQLDKDKPL